VVSRFARLVLLVLMGVVLLPLRAVAATVPMLIAYDGVVRPTATVRVEARPSPRAERCSASDYVYDDTRDGYDGTTTRRVIDAAGGVHAYDHALNLAKHREVAEGVIYGAPAATAAAEGLGGAASTAARFATTAERAGVLEKVLTSDGALNTSQTVARQLAGQRGFIPVQSILDTIGSGARIAEPQGVAGQFMYRAGAAFNGSEGTLEVLVDEASGQVNHVLFRSGVSP
jgi:hypothetical protein